MWILPFILKRPELEGWARKCVYEDTNGFTRNTTSLIVWYILSVVIEIDSQLVYRKMYLSTIDFSLANDFIELIRSLLLTSPNIH